MKLLIIEDDLSLINGLSFALKKQGYELDIARTNAEATAIFENGKYNLVILDVSLPDGTGFDICKKSVLHQKCRLFFSLLRMRKQTL